MTFFDLEITLEYYNYVFVVDLLLYIASVCIFGSVLIHDSHFTLIFRLIYRRQLRSSDVKCRVSRL